MRESSKKREHVKGRVRRHRLRRILTLLLGLMLVSTMTGTAATKTSGSELFIHSDYSNYRTSDAITGEDIVMPASYSNTPVSPAATGIPELAGVDVYYTAEGPQIRSETAMNNVKNEGAKSYSSYTSAKFYCFDLAEAVKTGAVCEMTIHNLCIYDNSREPEKLSNGRWGIYDLKISLQPSKGDSYSDTTGTKRKHHYLWLGKSIMPTVGIFGVERCYLHYEYYVAGTDEPAEVSTYLVYDDLDCGQGIWLRNDMTHIDGMGGNPKLAVSPGSNLGYTRNDRGELVIRQLKSASNASSVKDSIGIYYRASDFELGFSSNYTDGKCTGCFSGFAGNSNSMTDREPNNLHQYITTESRPEGFYDGLLSAYDELWTCHIQHAVAAGYRSGGYFTDYIMTMDIPDYAYVDEPVRIKSGGTDVTGSFNISEEDGIIRISAKGAAIGGGEFYGRTYSIMIPLRIRDCSECMTDDDYSEFFGADYDESCYRLRIRLDPKLEINTATGRQYKNISANEASVTAVLLHTEEKLMAPSQITMNSLLKARAVISVDDSSERAEGNRIFDRGSFYITNESGDTVVSELDAALVNRSRTTEGDITRCVNRLSSSIPIELEPGRYILCFKSIYKVRYKNQVSETAALISRSFSVIGYSSEGEDGPRYINENIHLSGSRWSSGVRKEQLDTVLHNTEPEELSL